MVGSVSLPSSSSRTRTTVFTPVSPPQLEAFLPHLLWRVDPDDVQVAVINTLLILVGVARTALCTVVPFSEAGHFCCAGSIAAPGRQQLACLCLVLFTLSFPKPWRPQSTTDATTWGQQGVRDGQREA